MLVCQETLPSRSIRRSVSRLTAGTTFCLTRCSASLVRLQVENAEIFQSAGDVRAIRQMCSRTWLLIILGRPPLHFGSSVSKIARRSRTASFAVRLIRCSRRPSSMLTGRTNTPGRRPTTTSTITTWKQPAAQRTEDQLPDQGSEPSHQLYLSRMQLRCRTRMNEGPSLTGMGNATGPAPSNGRLRGMLCGLPLVEGSTPDSVQTVVTSSSGRRFFQLPDACVSRVLRSRALARSVWSEALLTAAVLPS